MYHILLVIQVIVTLALIMFVLLQRSESDGFGLGSSSGGGVMSGKAKANFMTRTTAILAAIFMANSLLLAIVTSQNSGDSITNRIAEQQQEKKELSAPLGDELDTSITPVAPVDNAPTDALPSEAPTPGAGTEPAADTMEVPAAQ